MSMVLSFSIIIIGFLLCGVNSQLYSQPSKGDCVCATTTLNGRDSGSLSGHVVVVLSPNSCGKIDSGVVTNDGYTWFKITYNGQGIWVAGNYLRADPSSCDGSSSITNACPVIISRSEWNAHSAKSVTYLSNQPVKYAFIHHSETPECFDTASCARSVRGFQNYHMDHNGWSDIGYSFIIGGDGSVYEGRGWDRVGAHTAGYNSVGLGFCLIGSFGSKSPPVVQMNAVQQLIRCGVAIGKIRSDYSLRGHRDMSSTSCPGNRLYSIIQGWPHY